MCRDEVGVRPDAKELTTDQHPGAQDEPDEEECDAGLDEAANKGVHGSARPVARAAVAPPTHAHGSDGAAPGNATVSRNEPPSADASACRTPIPTDSRSPGRSSCSSPSAVNATTPPSGCTAIGRSAASSAIAAPGPSTI